MQIVVWDCKQNDVDHDLGDPVAALEERCKLRDKKKESQRYGQQGWLL